MPLIAPHVKAWIHREPWRDAYEVRFVIDNGTSGYWNAGGLTEDGGRLRYDKVEDEGAILAPAFILSEGEVAQLLEALKEHAKPVDATVDALRDTREIRDRLLTIIEKTVAP